MFIKKRGLSVFLMLCMICTMFIGMPVPVSAALDLPTGSIYDADVLQNGSIAAVFINGGNVYYGIFNPTTGSWISEDIGAGKDVALALDASGNPHVAYIDTNDDLVYKYHDGTDWSSGETIDSISFGGVDGPLSYPDIAIDGNGKVHLVYLDAKGGYEGGNDYSSYEKEDLVYATNAGGTFVKTVRSYSHGWFYSPDGWRNLAMAPVKIALAADSYYIGIKQYNYDKWMGGQYHTYNYNLLLPTAEPSNDLTYDIRSASTNNDLGFKLYDMGSYGANVYSLFNKSGSIYITNGVTEIPAAAKAFSAVGADLFVDGSGALYYAAVNGTDLLLHQNGAFKENLTLPASLHSTHTIIATVVTENMQYVLYTDSTGKIRVHGVSTGADSEAPAWLEALPGTSDITTTGFSVTAGIDEPGTVYYIVVDRDETAPTHDEVKAGVNYGTVTKRASGNSPILGNITDVVEVTGLFATTDYDVYFIAQDNEGNLQNEPAKLQITTASPSLEGSVAISGTLKYNETLTATVTGAQGDASPQYQWKRNDIDISGATNSTYTTVQDDIDTTISVVVTATNYSGSLSDTAGSAISKADGPAAPTNGIVDDANNTFNWTYVSGIETAADYEFSADGGTSWFGVTAKPIDVGNTAIAEGDLKVRVKATATHEAGAELASAATFTEAASTAVTFSDSDADQVYFNGDILTFNIAGLDVLNGQTVRVAFGVVGQSGIFAPAAVISGLTPLNNGVQQFSTATISGGSLSTNITGTILDELPNGIVAVQLYTDADGPGPGNVWINVLSGQPITHIALSADNKPALAGIALPAEITSTPVLGSGEQSSENLYNMDIAFQKEIVDGITGKISFTGLDLIGNKEQLAQLSTGLTMFKEATPEAGSLEEYTLGVDVAEALPFLADKGAEVSVTSQSFNGRTTADFIAVAGDVEGGEVSGLTFDDNTDTITFTVNHFSYYKLSMTTPSCDTPSLIVSGTTVSWSAVAGAVSYKVQLYQSDGMTTVGDEITVAADTTSYDLDTITPALAVGDYKVKVMAAGDGTMYEDSLWSDLSDEITIKNKVTIALRDGYTNPTEILNNGNTGVFKFKISGQGISVSGDTNPVLKEKLSLAIGNTVNCTFNSGDINAYTLARIDNDNVEASINISSTATAGTTASFDVTVSIGNLSTTHQVGTPSDISITSISVAAPPQSTVPEAGNITVTRTSATAVNILISNAADGHTYRVYAAESGGSNIGMVVISMMGSTMSNVLVNSDVATIYITKQDSLNHAESARVVKVIDTYGTSLSPSGNQTFPTLAENYADGTQPTHTFVISNTGTAELGGVGVSISGTDSGDFTITQPDATIAAGESATFTVKANNNLGVNTYNATITVSAANIPDKAFTVTQAVAVLHTVTFNSNGGSAVNAQTVEHNGITTAPTPPTKEGYDFAGWFSDEALENQYNFSTPITGNVTLYAKWVLGITDAQKTAADKAALTWDIIKNTNILQNGVTADLNLTVTGTVYGSTISWNSSDTSTLSITGQVYRPGYNTGDKQVALTAAITKGQASVTKDFILTVLKLAPSTNADLSALSAEEIPLTPGFSSNVTSYTANVGYNTSSTIITATADSTATVKINGTAGTSKEVDLIVGTNTIPIEVTAQDDTTKKSYTLTISRAGDGSGGGNSGGGSSTVPVPPASITTTTSEKRNTTTVSTTLNAATDETTGTLLASIEASLMNNLTLKAGEIEAAGQKAIVEIKVEAAFGAKKVGVEIPREAFDKVAVETRAKVQVDAGIGTVTFGEKAVESISDAVNAGNISIAVSKIDASTLTKELQEKLGDRPVFDFSVRAGNTEISTFGGGNAEISIPYTPKTGEKTNSIIVYYIDNSGKLNTVRGKYDPATGTVNFMTGHFSQYAVGYNEVRFNDVADAAWFKEAVDFVSARSITLGTGNGNYSPNDNLTRGQYLVMMMRAYGITPDENPTDNFADGGNTYYTGYLATAKRLGIAGGVGNNLFAPNREITRQETFTLLYNALKKLDELPKGTAGKSLTSFSDTEKIADYAIEAMTLFAETGTISGIDGFLNPTITSTRAQMAQVMYNLLSK